MGTRHHLPMRVAQLRDYTRHLCGYGLVAGLGKAQAGGQRRVVRGM
jgi:hypothetical protein